MNPSNDMANDDSKRIEGLECPRCGESYDYLMDRPALKRSGWNPRSGALYDCGSCLSRVTQFEIETGEELSELIDGDCQDYEPERPESTEETDG